MAKDVVLPKCRIPEFEMNNRFCQSLLFASIMTLSLVTTAAEDVNVTIRRAPYDVPNVSSKSEIAHKPCQYCGSSVSYERKYRWNTVRHEWVETTKAENVPTTCRKCEQKEKDQAKLDRKENELDRRIEYEKTKSRISSMERRLQRLRNANR